MFTLVFLLNRYSREESFTALNVDIRNQQHLFESLDAFVKGDLLEGANAYHCEKCDKKVGGGAHTSSAHPHTRTIRVERLVAHMRGGGGRDLSKSTKEVFPPFFGHFFL